MLPTNHQSAQIDDSYEYPAARVSSERQLYYLYWCRKRGAAEMVPVANYYGISGKCEHASVVPRTTPDYPPNPVLGVCCC